MPETLVTPVFLYGSDTWKVNKTNNKKLGVFQDSCLYKNSKY